MEPGFTRIVHPGLGPTSIAEVPESSLFEWYQRGWRLLKDDEAPAVPPLDVPPAVTLADVTAPAEPPAAKKENK